LSYFEHDCSRDGTAAQMTGLVTDCGCGRGQFYVDSTGTPNVQHPRVKWGKDRVNSRGSSKDDQDRCTWSPDSFKNQDRGLQLAGIHTIKCSNRVDGGGQSSRCHVRHVTSRRWSEHLRISPQCRPTTSRLRSHDKLHMFRCSRCCSICALPLTFENPRTV
jgi:hypothetical protein